MPIRWNGKKRTQPVARLGEPPLPAASVLAQAIWIDAVTAPACLASIARALSLTPQNVESMKAALFKARDTLRWLAENEDMFATCREHQELVLEDIERLSDRPLTFRGEAEYPWCRDLGDVVQFGAVEFFETVGRDEREGRVNLWGWPDDHRHVPAILRGLADQVEADNKIDRTAAISATWARLRPAIAEHPSEFERLREIAVGASAE